MIELFMLDYCGYCKKVIAFMDEHNIEKAHILGFSDGGNIATIFSILYPITMPKSLFLSHSQISPTLSLGSQSP